MADPRSRQELYDIIKNEAQIIAPLLTDFEEGAINDAIAGSTSLGMSELVNLILQEFQKSVFQSATGTDLEDLAKDHFGDDFANPGEQKSVGVVNFTRPVSTPGDVTISAGTIVKTVQNANGEEQRFATSSEVILTGLSIFASVEAVVAGPKGNVTPGEVIVVETALTDPAVVVTNGLDFSGGDDALDDDEYLDFIRNKIKELAGATCLAIEAKLQNVSGIEKATVYEELKTVIEYNAATLSTVGESFRIPVTRAFIADANGTANQALLDLAEIALTEARGCGVRITAEASVAVALDWTASLTLDPGGPNFATFTTDRTLIEDTMRDYLQVLAIGEDFVRISANAALIAIWGPTSGGGTGDLIAGGFVTSSPGADISADVNERIIPNTIGTV